MNKRGKKQEEEKKWEIHKVEDEWKATICNAGSHVFEHVHLNFHSEKKRKLILLSKIRNEFVIRNISFKDRSAYRQKYK